MIKNLNKVIHQIWLQPPNGNSPNRYKKYANTYRDYAEKNNWKYFCWTNETAETFVKSEFPHYYDRFYYLDSVIKKADCLRYMLLYSIGGLYVDMDTYLKGDLNEFINSKEIVRGDYEYTPWYIDPKLKIEHNYNLIVGQEKSICEYHYNKFGLQIQKLNNAVMFGNRGYGLFLDLIKQGFILEKNTILNSFGVHMFSNMIYKRMAEFTDDMLYLNDYKIKSDILTLPYIYFHEMDVDSDYYLNSGGKKEFVNDKRQLIVHDFDCNWDDLTGVPNEN